MDNKPAFSFGQKSSLQNANTEQGQFGSFGSANNSSKKPSLFGASSNSEKSNVFSFGSINDSKNNFTFGNSNKSVNNEASVSKFEPSQANNNNTSAIATKFGITSEPDVSKTKPKKPLFENNFKEHTMNENRDIADSTGNSKKEEDNKFLKNYQAPMFNNSITNTRDIDNDENMKDEGEEDDKEFFDIDDKSNLLIRHLNYSDTERSLLNKNEHLEMAISNKTEKGVIFVSTSDNKGEKDSKNTKLFPFDLVPQLDKSLEYKKFLKNTFENFEPLLKNKKYQNYLNFENDEYMQIGVVSALKAAEEERNIFLKKIMTTLVNDLQILIKNKMEKDKDFSDQWIFNFEEIINVLYLLNALHFSNADENIVLFQQWIERVDIQPTQELLEVVFKESDKPFKNYSFWNVYVKKLLIRGSFAALVDDLDACQFDELKGSDDNLFNLIEDFITMIKSYDPIKFSYDKNEFLKWKKNAVELRESSITLQCNNIMIHGEILELLKILSGSNTAIEESSTTWYETFMGFYLYQMPSKELIPEYINKSLLLDTYDKPILGIDAWDSICVELFKGKYLTVISSLETLDKSIGTFVAILMEASGLLDSYITDIPKDDMISKVKVNNEILNNIDCMIEDLALTYLNNQSLFEIGVGILINIGSDKSREILSELLPTYEIKDSDDFEWVLSVCSKLKLTKTMETIRNIQGEKLISNQRIPDALTCYADAQSSNKIIATVWRLFEEVLINKSLDKQLEADLFESKMCEDNVILRQSLAPLYILKEIVKPNSIELDPELWFKRLISLFNFKYLPEYYKIGLIFILFDNIHNNIFNIDNIVAIIECLNRYEKTMKSDEEVIEKSTLMFSLILENDTDSKHPTSADQLMRQTRRGLATKVCFGFLDESVY